MLKKYERGMEEKECVLLFSSNDCAPCEVLKRDLEQNYTSGLEIYEVDAWKYADVCARYEVCSTPTVVVIKGNSYKKASNIMLTEQLNEFVNR